MTDGNTYAINKHLNDQEDYDALQEVTTELEQAEAKIVELEAKLKQEIKETERVDRVWSDNYAELEAKLAKAREEGFWAGRSCGGSKKEIDDALSELKGQDDG